MTGTSRYKTKEARQPHWIEWTTGAVSAALVAMLIGWIAWDALTPEDDSPDLSVRLVDTEPRQNGYQVRFEVSNAARATAADVVVRGELRDGDQIVEVVETTLDYVPMQSKASGGLIFQHAPGELSVRLSAIGYSEP